MLSSILTLTLMLILVASPMLVPTAVTVFNALGNVRQQRQLAGLAIGSQPVGSPA